MSIIGPRPYFADDVLERPEAAEILSVRPGITGLWQVNGRSDRTFNERIAFHLDYGRGPSLDVRIIASTTSLSSAVEGVLGGRSTFHQIPRHWRPALDGAGCTPA